MTTKTKRGCLMDSKKLKSQRQTIGSLLLLKDFYKTGMNCIDNPYMVRSCCYLLINVEKRIKKLREQNKKKSEKNHKKT